jgi:hypothetical protein
VGEECCLGCCMADFLWLAVCVAPPLTSGCAPTACLPPLACRPARLPACPQVAHALQGECSWVAGALPESCPALPLALLGALLAKFEKPFKQRLGVAMAASAGGWGRAIMWGGAVLRCWRGLRPYAAACVSQHACMSPHPHPAHALLLLQAL